MCMDTLHKFQSTLSPTFPDLKEPKPTLDTLISPRFPSIDPRLMSWLSERPKSADITAQPPPASASASGLTSLYEPSPLTALNTVKVYKLKLLVY